MLLREVKAIFHKELDPIYGKEEVSSFFYLLIEHYLGMERFVLALNPNLMIKKEEQADLFNALSELKLEKPIQYITRRAHFMDLDFEVGPEVLIPRPETEELVRWVIEDFDRTAKKLKILDLGTGSGCIAISLSMFLENAHVQALDVSLEALEIAKKNAQKNEVNVHFFKANILDLHIEQKFDIIISNPPYVRELEKNNMKKNVFSYEPGSALFVPNDDPLIFYKRIADFATTNLNDNGILYLEINQYLGNETSEMLSRHEFRSIELRKDIYGNDRMIKAIKQ